MSSVLVVMEHREGTWNRLSWEALAAGQELSMEIGQTLSAAIVGSSVAPLMAELAGKAVPTLYCVQHALLERYTSDGFVLALQQLIQKVSPSYVVLPHTYQVRDFAPGLAVAFEETLIADVIGFKFSEGRPVFVRQLLQGKLNADYAHTGAGPCFVSVQAGAFRPGTLDTGSAQTEMFTPELDALQIRTKPEAPFREAAQTVDLGSANIIVSVGRGIKDKGNLPIVEQLASALGAEMAATKPNA